MDQFQADFNNSQSGGRKVSLAYIIVPGGRAAVEQAAKNAGHSVTIPFTSFSETPIVLLSVLD